MRYLSLCIIYSGCFIITGVMSVFLKHKEFDALSVITACSSFVFALAWVSKAVDSFFGFFSRKTQAKPSRVHIQFTAQMREDIIKKGFERINITHQGEKREVWAHIMDLKPEEEFHDIKVKEEELK